jgi:hypothetical protein
MVDKRNDIDPAMALEELAKIINDTKDVAKRYRRLTGRPLGIIGEVAEYEADIKAALEAPGSKARNERGGTGGQQIQVRRTPGLE